MTKISIFKINKRPILITGSHRSGSTWVGKIISESPSVVYIHEPFNIEYKPARGINNVCSQYWFTYISYENEYLYYQKINDIVKLKYNLSEALKTIKARRQIFDVFQESLNFTKYRLLQKRPLLKDPIAFFSAEYLAAKFNMDIVVLIRHPAAFAGSLKEKNWTFPFSHFLNQPLLMKEYLSSFETEIKAYAEKEYDIIDQASLLWKIIHYMILKYQKQYKNWLFVRHEDISREPIQEFKNIFNYCNLEFSTHIEKVIEEYTSYKNSAKDRENKITSLKRDSRSNIWKWKQRLTTSEIERIRAQVEDISTHFYSNEDW